MNKSTTQSPLAFFDWYLDIGVYDDLKKFYNIDKNDPFIENEVIKVDFDKKIILYITPILSLMLLMNYLKNSKTLLVTK